MSHCASQLKVISPELGEKLWRDYGKQVAVEFPSIKTAGEYQLTAQSYVGYIPLSPQLHLWLSPKVPIGNLFRVWEYAYGLKMDFLPGLYTSHTIGEFYESLAIVLARKVLRRAQVGLYRSYVSRTELLPHVRGRLDRRAFVPSPGDPRLRCHYRLHTADLEENRILAWTLFSMARCPLTQRSLPYVRQAYHALEESVTLQPYSAADCVGRRYNRLNEDYRRASCAVPFFLEGSGPSHHVGQHNMLPFLIDMSRLFELFVAQWLRTHLPAHVRMQEQERVLLGAQSNLSFQIDIVLGDKISGQVLTVLDTKYKRSSQPSAEDVAQVVAYAQAKGCREAVLVYPLQSTNWKVLRRCWWEIFVCGACASIWMKIWRVRVRSL
jgi:5-methylcytosine-specific restriction enzyme subunit McrC